MYWRHEKEGWEPAHSRAASGLVHARRPKWGSLSSWKSKQTKGAPPCCIANKEAHSMTLESHLRGMESSQIVKTAWHITTILQRQDYQSPEVLKIKATRASVKALRGYEHVGEAVSPTMNHTNTSQHRRKGKDLYSCTQTNMCDQVYLSGFYFGGASLGSVPHPHRVVCAKNKKKVTHTLNFPSRSMSLAHSLFNN